MAGRQIEINGDRGVYNVYEDRDRWTIYKYVGKFRGEINESSVLLRLIADNEVELIGFAVKPNIVSSPYIGGFENDAPQPSIPQIPNEHERRQDGGFVLNVLPCASEKATVTLLDKSLTKKSDNSVEFQLLLFSLTYRKEYADKDLLAKCDYDIIGEDGVTYVSMRQHQGAKSGDLGGNCPNNHPRFEDDKEGALGLREFDCKVYLPKMSYTVKMRSTGLAPIKPWVHHPSTNAGENRDIYVGRLEVGQEVSVFIDKNQFNGEDYRNAVKINGNCAYDM